MNQNHNDQGHQPKFSLGQIVATPGAIRALEQNNVTAAQLLYRHCQGDWGELNPEDIQANEDGLKHGSRLLSNYPIASDCRIWVITECDRSVTTLLLPEEY